MEKYITTTELDLAATLLCNGIELAGVKLEDPARHTVTFSFPDTEDAQAVTAAFMRGDSRVEPKAYSATVKRLLREMQNLWDGRTG